MEWKNVYIFISSTFNDMHAERDYLLKYVFPDLREWCSRRKINLIDVDLRWGITEEDAKENKKVVDICLKNVDKARPIFLCFLGQRRGWVPSLDDISTDTFSDFPQIKSEIGNKSVTELEIMHACFTPFGYKERVDCKPFFFLRDPSYLSEIDNPIIIEQLFTNEYEEDNIEQEKFWDMLLSKIPLMRHFVYSAKWNPELYSPEVTIRNQFGEEVFECKKGRLCDFFVGERTLKDVIITEIIKEIETIFSDDLNFRMDSLDDSAKLNEAFFQRALKQYVERESDDVFLDKYIFSDMSEFPIYIISPHGMGKTSYISKCIERYSGIPNSIIIYRFIGIDHRIIDEETLINSILEELLSQNLFIENDVPQDPIMRCEKFYEILDIVESKLNKLIIFVDGIDQLGIALDKLKYIPTYKSKIKFVVSCSTESADKNFINRIKRCVQTISVHEFSNSFDKINLSNSYFENYLKTPDQGTLSKIVDLDGSSNPLYLKILLSELRLYGSFETLNDRINSEYGDTPFTAFSKVIERLILDPTYLSVDNYQAVKCALGILACSKTGLTQDEYVVAVNFALGNKDDLRINSATEVVFYYYRQLQDYIIFDNGVFSIRYESFKKAILTYFEKSVVFFHKCVAMSMMYNIKSFNNSKKRVIPFNSFMMLPFHLLFGGETEALCGLLKEFNFVLQKTKYCGAYRMLLDFELIKTREISCLYDALKRVAHKFEKPEDNCQDTSFDESFALYFLGHISEEYSDYSKNIKTNFLFIKTTEKFFDNKFSWKRPFDGIVCHLSCLNNKVNLVYVSTKNTIDFYQFEGETGEELNHFRMKKDGVTIKYCLGNPILGNILKQEASKQILHKFNYCGKEYVYPHIAFSEYSIIVGHTKSCDLPTAMNSNYAFVSVDNVLKIYNLNGQFVSSQAYNMNINEIIANDKYLIIRSDIDDTDTSKYWLVDLESESRLPICSIKAARGRLHLVANSFVLDYKDESYKISIVENHIRLESGKKIDYAENFYKSTFYSINLNETIFQAFESYVVCYKSSNKDITLNNKNVNISVFESENQIKWIEHLAPYEVLNKQKSDDNIKTLDFSEIRDLKICSTATLYKDMVIYLFGGCCCLICVSIDGKNKGKRAIINIPDKISCKKVEIISDLLMLFTDDATYYIPVRMLDIRFNREINILDPAETLFKKANFKNHQLTINIEAITDVYCKTKDFLVCGTKEKNKFGFIKVKNSEPVYSEFSFSDKFKLESVALCDDNLILFMNSRIFAYKIDAEKLKISAKKDYMYLSNVKCFKCSVTNANKVYVLAELCPGASNGDLCSVFEVSVNHNGILSLKNIVSIDKPVESIIFKNNTLFTVYIDGTFSAAKIPN